MQCSHCQAENRAGRRFRSACGAALGYACPSCGFSTEPGERFCGGCGRRLTEAPPSPASTFASPQAHTPHHLAEKILTSRSGLEGERKQVTVFFAELKGSMELLADRDPEDARRLPDPVLERMIEAVHRYEETVNQVMGDGLMALFGVPEERAWAAGQGGERDGAAPAHHALPDARGVDADRHRGGRSADPRRAVPEHPPAQGGTGPPRVQRHLDWRLGGRTGATVGGVLDAFDELPETRLARAHFDMPCGVTAGTEAMPAGGWPSSTAPPAAPTTPSSAAMGPNGITTLLALLTDFASVERLRKKGGGAFIWTAHYTEDSYGFTPFIAEPRRRGAPTACMAGAIDVAAFPDAPSAPGRGLAISGLRRG